MWNLDPSRRHLNHGSFGATPGEVLEARHQWELRLEANPTSFVLNELPAALERARLATAAFVDADPGGLVFVPNASTAVASVLRSIEPLLEPGDEILTTAHDYNAVRQMLRFLAERTGVIVRVAEVPFPIAGGEEVTTAVLAAMSRRTRLVIVDHITSSTGLLFPIEEIVSVIEPDVPVLVDGAHGPGQVGLHLRGLGASWYAGNLHKWVCAPKGAGFLYTREDHRETTVPTVISHGWNAEIPQGSSRYRLLFDWTGTDDFGPWLVVPDAIETVASATTGGWDEVMRHNHDLVVAARRHLLSTLGLEAPAPESMLGSMAAFHLPDASTPDPGGELSPLMAELDTAGFEVIVAHWPAWPSQLLRVSAHLYNKIDEYHELGRQLVRTLGL